MNDFLCMCFQVYVSLSHLFVSVCIIIGSDKTKQKPNGEKQNSSKFRSDSDRLGNQTNTCESALSFSVKTTVLGYIIFY